MNKLSVSIATSKTNSTKEFELAFLIPKVEMRITDKRNKSTYWINVYLEDFVSILFHSKLSFVGESQNGTLVGYRCVLLLYSSGLLTLRYTCSNWVGGGGEMQCNAWDKIPAPVAFKTNNFHSLCLFRNIMFIPTLSKGMNPCVQEEGIGNPKVL